MAIRISNLRAISADSSVSAIDVRKLIVPTGSLTNNGGGTITLAFAGDGSAFTNINASNIATGTLNAGRLPAFTGDVTTSAGSSATTIASASVTLAKMANLAANSIIGNNTGVGATPIALTATQVKTLLAIASTDVSGLGSLATLSAAPAGTLTGTTLNATVVNSSLTSVGTLTSGSTGAGFTVALSTATITGTLADARLSANVPLLNAANTFTNANTINPPTSTYGLTVNIASGNISGTSSQGYRMSFPAAVNNSGVTRPPFTLVTTESLDANSNIDYVAYFGHNFAPTGRVDTSQAAVGIGFEQYWMNQMEHHVSVGIWPDGTMVRAASVVFPVATKEPLWYHIGSQHDFYTRADNAAGRTPFATLTCLGADVSSTFYVKNYNVAASTYWGVSISMGPSASGLNENVIAATGTTGSNGNLQINATGQLKLQQNLINIALSPQLITFNANLATASNSITWKSNVILATNKNVLLDSDGYIGWGNQGSSNWPAVARLVAFNSTNNLTLENRATSGVCLWGNQNTGNTAGTVQIQNKGVVVLTINSNNTTTLNGTLTAGGLTTAALQVCTNGPLIYSGSGAPTISAAVKGSLYLRTDGSSTSTRLYVATDTAGTWTAVTTGA